MKAYLIPTQTPDAPPLELSEYSTVGQSNSCSNALADTSIGDRQFSITFRQNHYWIRDFRSGISTFVNDTEIKESPLAEGDIIKCGNLEFRFSKFAPSKMLHLKSSNSHWASELQRLGSAANTQFPILILGPSGAGKDVLAQAIHQSSPRKGGAFVSVNCSALTESLIESELFGHVKGSFTGAISDRKGAFEAARNGTLFLDEIGDLPLSMQAKLLRALENNEIRPVGSDQTLKTNVRILAATHQNLLEKIREGQFRSDLYYRLNVVSVQHPSLAQRMEDFESLLNQFTREYRVRIAMDTVQKLHHHAWPGNIRELKNFVARCSALYPGQKITTDLLPALIDQVEVPQYRTEEMMNSTATNVPMPIIKDIEKQMIIKRLMANRGNQRRTAHDLGLPKSTLHDRIRAYQINPRDFKYC